MSEQTKIQWCDSTLNFWEGCTKVSPGCTNCYAEERDGRFHGGAHWGPSGIRRKSKSAVKDALAFNCKPWICDDCGFAAAEEGQEHDMKNGSRCWHNPESWHRRRIFSLSLGDWLEGPPVKVIKGVPYGGVPVEWRAEMLDTIRRCDRVEWILCTKRIGDWWARITEVIEHVEGGKIEDIGDRFPETELGDWLNEWTGGNAPKNVTLVTSIENQEQADKRIPALLRIPAARRGLSLEPLLGPVNVNRVGILQNRIHVLDGIGGPDIDWLIIGGESGPKARPCNVDWIRSLVRQGNAAGVPVFVKQLGAKPVYTAAGISPNGDDAVIHSMWNDSRFFIPWNSSHNGAPKVHDRKGADPAEWPEDLRVQEWPEGMN